MFHVIFCVGVLVVKIYVSKTRLVCDNALIGLHDAPRIRLLLIVRVLLGYKIMCTR